MSFDDLFSSLAEEDKYCDPDFPAEANSLIPDWDGHSDVCEDDHATWKAFQWIRAQDCAKLKDAEGNQAVF